MNYYSKIKSRPLSTAIKEGGGNDQFQPQFNTSFIVQAQIKSRPTINPSLQLKVNKIHGSVTPLELKTSEPSPAAIVKKEDGELPSDLIRNIVSNQLTPLAANNFRKPKRFSSKEQLSSTNVNPLTAYVTKDQRKPEGGVLARHRGSQRISNSRLRQEQGQGGAIMFSDQEEQKVTMNDIQLTKILLDMPAPLVSAQSWAIFDMKTEAFLFGKMERERREIASLTKIMTCLVVLKLLKHFNLDEHTTMIEVSENAANIAGTSAELQQGDHLSVWDLLHGLMLPSGNDAAIALAEYFGSLMLSKKQKSNGKDEQTTGASLGVDASTIQSGVKPAVGGARRNIFLTRNSQF